MTASRPGSPNVPRRLRRGGFRTIVLEQSVGQLSPSDALDATRDMIADGRVLKLEGGLMTTRAVRAQEEAIESRFATLARSQGHIVSEQSRTTAHNEVAERIGG